MNTEEIDYWLRYFSNHNHGFMSKDRKKITRFKVFQELKELQYLLKIKNDYINESQQENQKLKEKIKTYEDPEDLTLMFMYCDEKAKDKIKELKKQIDFIENKEEK